MISCGFEVERRSNCDEVIGVKWVHVHVWWALDDCLKLGLDADGGRHDMSDEKCHPGEKYLYPQVNGDEIGEAWLDPDSEEVYDETCQSGKVSVCVMKGEV